MRLVLSETELENIAGVRRGSAPGSAVGGSDNILNLHRIKIKTKGGTSAQNTDNYTTLFNTVAINVIKTTNANQLEICMRIAAFILH